MILTRVIRQVLGDAGTVECVVDGEQAISLLAGEGEFADRTRHPFPSTLITDLNMPRVDGFGVLEFLAFNDGWSVFPKIVISNSDDPDDVRTAIRLGANAYHRKPLSLHEATRLIQLLIAYWDMCEVPVVDQCGRIKPTIHAGKHGQRFPLPEAGACMRRCTPPSPHS
jgi:CheY-like chemotaxis protein